MKAAEVEPNVTAVAPVKLVPVIVTAVPTGPVPGLKPVIVGAVLPPELPEPTVNELLEVPVPVGVVTEIGPVEAPVGTVVVIWFGAATVRAVCLVLPKVTTVAPVKSVPVIVTAVPVGPLVGVKPVTVGAPVVLVFEPGPPPEPETKLTVAVWSIARLLTLSPVGVSVAEIVLVPAESEASVPVATPVESVGLAGACRTLPVPVTAMVTKSPSSGLPATSLAMTVIVTLSVPFATMFDARSTLSVELAASGARVVCETAPPPHPAAIGASTRANARAGATVAARRQ